MIRNGRGVLLEDGRNLFRVEKILVYLLQKKSSK
jgi:hypothetical protein